MRVFILSLLAAVMLTAQTPVTRTVVCTDAGSNDTYACSPTPAISSYTTGMEVRLYPNTANTGAATINISTQGAKTIKKVAGGITTDLADNDIRAGQYVKLVYDGTNFQMQSMLGNAASSTSTVGVPDITTKRWYFWTANGVNATPSTVGEAAGVSGTQTAVTPSSTDSAAIKTTTATTTAATAYWGGNSKDYLTRSPRWQARVKLAAASDYTTARVFIMWEDAAYSVAVALGSSPSTDTPTSKYFGFRGSTAAGDTNWMCIHSNAGGSTDTGDSGVAINTTGHVFEAYYDYANTQILYYIDGTRVCNGGSPISQTNIPTGTGAWRGLIGTVNLAVDSSTRSINLAAVYSESKW